MMMDDQGGAIEVTSRERHKEKVRLS